MDHVQKDSYYVTYREGALPSAPRRGAAFRWFMQVSYLYPMRACATPGLRLALTSYHATCKRATGNGQQATGKRAINEMWIIGTAFLQSRLTTYRNTHI
jgi:hypothetical protein